MTKLSNYAPEMRVPESIVASFTHDIFIQGCQINFALDKPTDLEATSLYPDTPFRSVDACFDEFVSKVIEDHVKNSKPTSGEGLKIAKPTVRSEGFVITLSAA